MKKEKEIVKIKKDIKNLLIELWKFDEKNKTNIKKEFENLILIIINYKKQNNLIGKINKKTDEIIRKTLSFEKGVDFHKQITPKITTIIYRIKNFIKKTL